jgi:hypothetical protein
MRLIPQEYQLLESCLPYKITTNNISADLESLIKSNGKLASHIYEEHRKQGKRGHQNTISNLHSEPAESIHQSMIFGHNNPNLIKSHELNDLVTYISE